MAHLGFRPCAVSHVSGMPSLSYPAGLFPCVGLVGDTGRFPRIQTMAPGAVDHVVRAGWSNRSRGCDRTPALLRIRVRAATASTAGQGQDPGNGRRALNFGIHNVDARKNSHHRLSLPELALGRFPECTLPKIYIFLALSNAVLQRLVQPV